MTFFQAVAGLRSFSAEFPSPANVRRELRTIFKLVVGIVEYLSTMESEFRRLPSVDRLISEERIGQLREIYPHSLVVDLVRQRLEQDRLSITLGNPCPSVDEIVESICSRAQALAHPSLRGVINASGVILHTNLGRAPLSKEAAAAMDLVAGT